MARRHFVVDADIVCSAGIVHVGETRPALCGRFLVALRDHGHHVTVTPKLLAEWRRHRSRFASTWLTSMFARKQILKVAPEPLSVESAFTTPPLKQGDIDIALKDVHLLEAALCDDRRVASLDEAARAVFKALASSTLPAIAKVHWINPERPAENCVDWLAHGAPDDRARLLG